MKRFLAVLHARNLEFVRDKGSMGWNLLLPILLVFGLATVFSYDRPMYQVGVLADDSEFTADLHPFFETRYVDFFRVEDEQDAIRKLSRHQMDMLLDLRGDKRYWINTDSPNGYILERLLMQTDASGLRQETVAGQRIRYVDWLLPGILGMNMMFSCLFGVGYVIVRYRKNGFLKRLHATPLRAIEFIGAQLTSRLILIMMITTFVYIGTTYFVGLRAEGSHVTLFLVATLGAVSMIALGLLIAARVHSEELAGGILNMITWPMMLLSGVWFSMEGKNPLMQAASKFLPLTQTLDAVRAVIFDGATLSDISSHIYALAGMTTVFLVLGAWLFRWRLD